MTEEKLKTTTYDMSPETCDHGMSFSDEVYQKGSYTSSDVKRRWPRHNGLCKLCGYEGIAYKSFLHYVAGDW
jgi:hypothetical protein